MKQYNAKKSLVLLHFLIKKLPIKIDTIIYEKMAAYDLNLHFKKKKYKSKEEKSFFDFILRYWKYLLSISYYTNIYKEEIYERDKKILEQGNIDNAFEKEMNTQKNVFAINDNLEKFELFSQSLYMLIGTIEELSKLKA